LRPQIPQQPVEIGNRRAHRRRAVALSRSLEALGGGVNHRRDHGLCLRASCDITTASRR